MAEILKRETRFSWHIPAIVGKRDDYHYVREDVTYTDGKVEPRTFLVKDFTRPVWCTKEAFRNHREKKEFEDKDKLLCKKTTQSNINSAVANLLGQSYLVSSPDKLKASPYVYGYDIPSTSLLKLVSLKRNNFNQSKYSMASFDIETNVDTDEILMATIAYGNRTHTAVLRKYLKNIGDVNTRVKNSINNLLPRYSNLDFKVTIHNDEVSLLKDVFKVANEWKPVFLAIWNMDFDISKILQCLKRHNVNPIDVICDLNIPRHLRVCRYKQGVKKKVTASGRVKPVNPSMQWHTLICTSTFYVIDPMCAYRQLRTTDPEKPSYSLDYMLSSELNSGKLKFDAANKYKGAHWHTFMQENYPIEYIVYNLYDCLGMLELDTKLKDISVKLPSFAGITDFARFNSQVRKVSDALFLFGLDKDKVLGTAGSVTEEEEDTDEEFDEDDPSNYDTLGLKGWIQLLPQNLLLNRGLTILKDNEGVRTNVRGLTCDLDASSAYPSVIQATNCSKSTTKNELISVEGVRSDVFKEQNLSICLGNANILDYFNTMFDTPPIDTL